MTNNDFFDETFAKLNDGTIDIQERRKDYASMTPEERRFNTVLKTIFNVAHLGGFKIEGRIKLVDKKTGRVFE